MPNLLRYLNLVCEWAKTNNSEAPANFLNSESYHACRRPRKHGGDKKKKVKFGLSDMVSSDATSIAESIPDGGGAGR